MICFSVFLGSTTGYKAAKTKLFTAEAISEKLEEWKDAIPTEVPYKILGDTTENQENKNSQRIIEIG